EAATVDGAGAWRRFVHVTLPQLQSVLFVVVLLRSIWMFTKFDTPWLMIQGGGAETYIRTLPIYTYQRTFAYYEAGRGSAMAVIIPFYVLMRTLELTNTRAGLVLAYTAFCLPFALWLLRTFFQSIPLDLEEAALVDGASRPRAVLHVVLPLALPGVVATGTFT